MKTEDLILQLGRELSPVQRLASPLRRATVWLTGGVAYVAVMAAFAWVRSGALGIEVAAPYLLQQAALAVTAVLAALAAFASVIPGTASRARAALAAPVGLMMIVLLWGTVRDLRQFGTAGFGRETDWPCVMSITLGGLALWAVAGAMLRRGAPLEPRVTAVLAGVAALSLANVEACISRVHTLTSTVIAWHGTTVVLLLTGLLALGPRVLGGRGVS
jgi:hypothetical protein